jgi:hypothetical protein
MDSTYSGEVCGLLRTLRYLGLFDYDMPVINRRQVNDGAYCLLE